MKSWIRESLQALYVFSPIILLCAVSAMTLSRKEKEVIKPELNRKNFPEQYLVREKDKPAGGNTIVQAFITDPLTDFDHS